MCRRGAGRVRWAAGMRSLVLTLSLVVGCADPMPPPRAPISEKTPVADPKAMADLDVAERTLDAAGSDCAAACDAVRRMTSARLRLCSPKTSGCEDAERREGDGRRRVASFCECPP